MNQPTFSVNTLEIIRNLQAALYAMNLGDTYASGAEDQPYGLASKALKDILRREVGPELAERIYDLSLESGEPINQSMVDFALAEQKRPWDELNELQAKAQSAPQGSDEQREWLFEFLGAAMNFIGGDWDHSKHAERIYAMVTAQGTAMPETALCNEHYTEPFIAQATVAGLSAEDIGEDQSFHDCTGNTELACLECGATTP